MRSKTKGFENLEPELRGKLAAYFFRCRAKDRVELEAGEGWREQSRSLEEYCRRLGVLKNYLLLRLQIRQEESGRASVLDVGMGTGEALRELRARLGANLETAGMRLTFRALPEVGLNRLYIGPVEARRLPEAAFDLVLSCRGGMAYSLNAFSSAEQVLNSLRPGGLALIEDPRLTFAQNWFRHYLQGKGWESEVSRYQEGSPNAYKVVRLSGEPLDLSSFSRRYLDLVKANRQVFLENGFDRLEPDSPLNALFLKIYGREPYADLVG